MAVESRNSLIFPRHLVQNKHGKSVLYTRPQVVVNSPFSANTTKQFVPICGKQEKKRKTLFCNSKVFGMVDYKDVVEAERVETSEIISSVWLDQPFGKQ